MAKKKKSTFLTGYQRNFEVVKLAAFHQDLALVECIERATGKHVAILAAMGRAADGQVAMTPLARMLEGNPYEDLISPADPEFDRMDSTQRKGTSPKEAENRTNPANSGPKA